MKTIKLNFKNFVERIKRIKLSTKVLLISFAAAFVLILIGFLSKDPRIIGNTIIISMLIIIIPQSYFSYLEFRKIKEIEKKFPEFLRDLVESIRSGLPLYKAIILVSKYDYGKELSKEVKKMGNQLTWGLRVEKVLDNFIERVKGSKKLVVATEMIKQCYITGGDIVGVLESLAENLITLDEIESDRKSILNQYIILLYIISFIFLVIVVLLIKLLVPMFEEKKEETLALMPLKNPCSYIGYAKSLKEITTPPYYTTPISYLSCSLMNGVSSLLFLDFEKLSSYYKTLFFLTILVQSFFAGLVAGISAHGSVRAGIKHSLILSMINCGVFIMLIGLKFV